MRSLRDRIDPSGRARRIDHRLGFRSRNKCSRIHPSQQIKDRGYVDKYGADPRPKLLVGINFSRAEKTVTDWQMESVDGKTA